jgi:acetyl/propionyl-CoA carboxylase alpha subunit/acetyl-CoA carboxylase carboxyltransferase component
MANFTRLAVANRGAPAMRLVHAAREFAQEYGRDLSVLAVHTAPERDALYVREADEAVSIGPAAFVDPADGVAKSGFLDLGALERALRAVSADAVWIGWGPLAQQAEVPELCDRLGICYVGPGADALRRLADRDELGRLAGQAGVALAPASVVETGYERHLDVLVMVDQRGTAWAVGVQDGTLQRRTEKVLVETATAALVGIEDSGLRAVAVRLATMVGFVGAGTVTFVRTADAPGWSLLRMSAGLPLGHGVVEISTGLDLAKQQLFVAEGGRLRGAPPPIDGHAIAVRLNAEDAEQAFTPTPGTVALLQLPTGPGIRTDTGLLEGDALAPGVDPTIAEVVAWGRDREEARVRLRRALAQFPVVLDGGTTNKGFLLDLLDRPEVRTGHYDTSWLDRLAATGETAATRHADVAVLMAAVDAYDAELALERSRFFASARRGRPQTRADVGHVVELRHRGQEYAVEVARTGRHHYRASVDGTTVPLVVHRLGRFQSRVQMHGRTMRIVSAVQGGDLLVEVDGVPHRLSRVDGGVVRAASPGVVVAVPVRVGDEVAAGDTVVVLESMKMETAVAAPFAGRVRQVHTGTNVQVDAGAPLVQLEPLTAVVSDPTAPRVAFTDESPSGLATPERCRRNLDTLLRLVLGYDVRPGDARAVAADQAKVCEELPLASPEVVQGELALLTAYADVRALFRSHREIEEADLQVRSPQEHLHAYLRSLDAVGEGLPPRFLDNLRRALAHYDVHGLEHDEALEEALYWIFQSQQREDAQVPVVVALLNRWIDRGSEVGPASAERLRATLDRLVAATQRGRPVVADLAREVRYRLFDEPRVSGARGALYEAMAGHLSALETAPDGPDRDTHVSALVACPQPLAPLLLTRLDVDDTAARQAVLEVMTRRYYRLPLLRGFRSVPRPGCDVLTASYEEDRGPAHVVATCAPLSGLAVALDGLASVVGELAGAGLPTGEPLQLDVYAWLDGPPLDDASLAEEVTAAVTRLTLPVAPEHLVVAVSSAGPLERLSTVRHFTFRPDGEGVLREDQFLRGLHPMMAARLHLWRLSNFDIERLPSSEDVYLFRGVAHGNPKDERLFALAEVRDLTPVRDADGRVTALPEVERALIEALEGIRRFQAPRPPAQRLVWNRVTLHVWPPLELPLDEIALVARSLAPATMGLGIEEVVVQCRRSDPRTGARRERVLRLANPAGTGFVLHEDEPPTEPLAPLDEYTQKVVQSRRRGTVYPFELLKMLTAPRAGGRDDVLGGSFQEYDLDESNELVPVERPPGRNTAAIVVGLVANTTTRYPDGMRRVVLLGDPTKSLGSLAEPECRRVIAGLDLAERLGIPCEWFALSAGAKIALDSGTENMDWIADVLRRLITFTQAGNEINIVVTGINVGGQPYWNAEATMLMHTKGILVMTPDSAMVLTGKQALDFSGGVSAEDNHGIGGYERIMGPNGQAQYWAPDLTGAIGVLLAHYAHAYREPGERFPRRAITADPFDRDVRSYPHQVPGIDFTTVGDIFSDEKNPDRKQPFDIRTVMRSIFDQDHEPLERWKDLFEGDTTVVWDAHLGGWPVCAIGIEAHAIPRRGVLPADGPDVWTSGTLFPISSKKVARGINAASDNRPLVVVANLSGFDGSPESMRRRQLEFGAEIGRAVVNFRGPIVFCVVSRFHGGAFVVFSQKLNPSLEAIAVEGAHASVIGGAPAAAVVFASEVDARTRKDQRVVDLEARVAAAEGAERAHLRTELAQLTAEVRSEKLGVVADEFDTIHSVERAQRVGSVTSIIPAGSLRPLLIDALERGIRRELGAAPA